LLVVKVKLSSGQRLTWHHVFILGSTALWLMGLALIVKASLDQTSAPPWGNPRGDQLLTAIGEGSQVGQRFTAPLPGLYRIQVGLADATTGDMQPIIFHLKEDKADADDLWSATLSEGSAQADRLHDVEFPPLRYSKGQIYTFYLESVSATAEQKVSARYSPSARLEGASAYLDGQPVAGNLQFLTYYTLRTRDKADLLIGRMAESRPYLLGTKGFYIALAAVYVVVLGAFLARAAQAILREQEGDL
jgi:hypothetical protein